MGGKKIVMHVGPLSDKGGMSKVMKLLINHTSSDYEVEVFDTFLESSKFLKIINLMRLRKRIVKIIKKEPPDLMHFHLTHGFSWWRKLLLIRIVLKRKIPIVISIHSGKFELFCNSFFGIPGNILSKLSENKDVEIIVLEDRWSEKLKKYSENIKVIRNPVIIKKSEPLQIDFEKIKLLLIARNDSIKGHQFAIDIAECISKKGFNVSLSMTGVEPRDFKDNISEIVAYGWIENEEEVNNLILKTDFVLSPSRYEGSSMSILETMSMGKIPIVSKVSRETVGINDLVIDSFDAKEWGDSIIDIVSSGNIEYLQEEISSQISKHEVGGIANKWKMLYDLLINN